MENENYIYADTETTGLYPKSGDRIVELGLLSKLEDGTTATWHRYINPERSVPSQAVEVHGLTDEFLADKPRFAEIADELAQMLDGKTVVIHNANFDMAFLKAEFERLGQPMPKFVVIDTLATARVAMPGAQHNLDALCDKFGVDRSGRTQHGTLIDVALLAEVHPHLMEVKAQADARFDSFFGDFKLETAGSADTMDELLDRHALIKAAKTRLEKAEDRVRETVLGLTGAKDYFDDKGRSVEFSPGVRTNWEKVKKDHLKDVDLKPYQKAVTSMVVKS